MALKGNRKGGGGRKKRIRSVFLKNIKCFFFFFNQKDDNPSIYNDIIWGQFI